MTTNAFLLSMVPNGAVPSTRMIAFDLLKASNDVISLVKIERSRISNTSNYIFAKKFRQVTLKHSPSGNLIACKGEC